MKKKIALLGVIIMGFIVAGSLWVPTTAVADSIKLSYANFPPAPTFPCVRKLKKELQVKLPLTRIREERSWEQRI